MNGEPGAFIINPDGTFSPDLNDEAMAERQKLAEPAKKSKDKPEVINVSQ